jgi:hypothetical protein
MNWLTNLLYSLDNVGNGVLKIFFLLQGRKVMILSEFKNKLMGIMVYF